MQRLPRGARAPTRSGNNSRTKVRSERHFTRSTAASAIDRHAHNPLRAMWGISKTQRRAGKSRVASGARIRYAGGESASGLRRLPRFVPPAKFRAVISRAFEGAQRCNRVCDSFRIRPDELWMLELWTMQATSPFGRLWQECPLGAPVHGSNVGHFPKSAARRVGAYSPSSILHGAAPIIFTNGVFAAFALGRSLSPPTIASEIVEDNRAHLELPVW